MMEKLLKFIIVLLALFISWHGVITVFLPESFRYWKEIILVLILILSFFTKEKELSSFSKIKAYLQRLFSKTVKKPFWKKPIFYAALFLIWLGILSGIEQNYYSSISARYLGLGFFVFITFSIFLKKIGKKSQDFFSIFSTTFIYSSLLSVFFGIWGKFGNGFEILQDFYSITISSWVPGQTLPLYHEVEGFIRMQGGASGPVEFGHLLFVAIFLVLKKNKKIKSLDLIFLIILFFGIWQSGSRAALGGSFILLILFWFSRLKNLPDKILKYTKIWLGIVLLLALTKILVVNFLPNQIGEKPIDYKLLTINKIVRLSDLDHIIRPIQAVKDGLRSPIYGKLGSYGPGARMRNLIEKNNDQAPIAENIFADYFVQLGIVGLLLSIAFWWTLLLSVSKTSQVFIFTTFLLINLATIFDMTPLSIMFFSVFAFLVKNKK